MAQSQVLDFTGNSNKWDSAQIAYDSMTNVPIPAANQPLITAGTAAPTFSAPKGSLYLNLTGSSTATRMYVNTNGSTTWTNVTTAA